MAGIANPERENIMAKKHATIDSASLGIMVDSAKELQDKETENKQRDIEAGRRNEVDDLPTGHPLKVMMEEAKRRFEAQQQVVQERQTTIKVAKKATPQAQQQQEHDDSHKERKVAAQRYNDAVMKVLSGIEELRSVASDTSRVFNGFAGPRVKLARASRAAAAVGYALHESLIEVNERG